METTRNSLPPAVSEFFENLKQYVGKPLYFYGSVQRADFFPERSDIDVDIFTENPKSTMYKLHHFLNRPLHKFHRTVAYVNSKLVRGIKVFYKSEELAFSAEFSIFNEDDKSVVLYEHLRKTDLPFHIIWMLNLLKYLYYDLHLLGKETYKTYKSDILSSMLGVEKTPYVILK